MLANTQAIVLRAVKYSETSLICDFFTKDWGMRTYIINGVRQAAPVIAPLLLKPASLLDFVAYHQPSKDINRLKEAKAAKVYQQIPFSVTHGAVALFACELLQKLLKESPASVELYNFLYNFFAELDSCKQGLANLPLIFVSQLSIFMGFSPNIQTYQADSYFDYKNGVFAQDKPTHLQFFDAKKSQLLVDLLCTEANQSHTLDIPKSERAEMLEHLLDFYSFHVAGFSDLQAYKVLQEVF